MSLQHCRTDLAIRGNERRLPKSAPTPTSNSNVKTLAASDTFPAIAAAPRAAKMLAATISIVLVITFCGLAPFAHVALPRPEGLVPIYRTTYALISSVAAGFLFFGFRRSRLNAALVLGSGYLLNALAVIAALDLFGAGRQGGAWLDALRQGGFPLFVIGYAMSKRREGRTVQPAASARAGVMVGAAAVATLCLVILLAAAANRSLPPIIDGDRNTTAVIAVGAAAWFLSLVALVVLGARPPYSVVDLWLLVAVGAWLGEMALGWSTGAGRYDIGFYAGRAYGLFAVSVVPIALFVEASRIAGKLDATIALAEERNAALARSREELARAQRLEAVGQLTGGVAHDFNNLLTVVIGNLELILGARGDPAKIERLALNAIKAAQRGEHLVRQLLTYARRQIGHPQTVELNQLVATLENLIRRVIGEQIDVVTMLNPSLDPVRIDPGQFETAILNLAINARDAMTGGGRITIETRNVIVDPRQVADDAEVAPGPHVVVSVRDSGSGMTPAVLARAFDPFFTTKEVGKGSGLGLSQVYGFTKTAGGHVRIRSAPGAGTTVELYLPRASERPVQPVTEPELAPSPPVGGKETILLVEDDEDLLAMTAESLRELGYRILTAVDAAQALDILNSGQPIDLLFSDVIIPGGTNGAQLAVEARQIRPSLKVLLTSGYTATALSQEHGLPAELAVVDKPYQRDELARRLRAAISG
jgi:signal transduction histidine kinase/CheY-like chemotaxis protein